MKFDISFSTENDAFEDGEEELNKVMKQALRHVIAGRSGSLFDSNGNRVGSVTAS